MANDEWGMANGRWQMANAIWWMATPIWRMAHVSWRIRNAGGTDGGRSMAEDQCAVKSGGYDGGQSGEPMPEVSLGRALGHDSNGKRTQIFCHQIVNVGRIRHSLCKTNPISGRWLGKETYLTLPQDHLGSRLRLGL